MADSVIKAGIQISADVAGAEQINQLSSTIKQAASETSELTTQAEKLEQQWREAQANQALITHYRSLKSALADNRTEITQTEQQMRQLAAQMQNGATAKQSKQYNDLQNNLTHLNAQKRELLNQLRQTDSAMGKAGISTQNLTNQSRQFAAQADKAQQELTELNAEAQRLQKIAQAKATLGLDIDDQAREEIAQLDRAFDELKRSGKLSQAELSRAAQHHAQKVNEIEKSLQRVKPTLSEVTDGLGDLAKAGGLAYVANQAMEFETAMASVRKVTDGSEEDYARLASSLKTLADELGVMPAALAEIAAAGGQANVALNELPKFTKMAAQMSVAFKIPAEEAGDMAAKIGNVFQIPIDKVGELMDAVNVLGNNTAAKEAEISDVLMRVGGSAKQFGLAAEEAAALGAAFISLGKTPEVAGTAINALLSKLQNSTKQGSEFKNALKDIGLSAQEMADNIAANPQAALTDFLQRLEKLDEQTRSMVLSDLFGAEYSDDLALLSGSLKTYTDALADATDKTQTLGAMQKEVDKSLETTSKKIDQAKASIASSAATVGEALLPVLQLAAQSAAGVGKALGYVAEEFPILAQLATLFVTGKLAVTAYQMAIKMAGTDSVTAMTKTDASISKVRSSLKGAAVDAKLFGVSMQTTNAGVGKLGSGLSGLANNAAMLGSAFLGGFGIGDALYQESETVRWAGDKIASVFAMIDSYWETGSLDKYRAHFKTYAQSEKEAAELKRKTELAEKQKSETVKQEAAKQAQYIEQLTAKYRQEQKQLNATDTTLRQLENSGQANTEMYRRMTEQKKQLETQIGKTRAELTLFQTKIDDVSPLAKNRQALEDLGLTAEQMATGISKSAQSSLDNFKLAAQTFGNDTESMATLFQAAVSKMDTPEAMTALKQALTETGAKAGLTAEQINFIAASATTASLNLSAISKPLGAAQTAADSLGISLTSALSGSSPEFQAALMKFSAIRSQLDGLAEQGMNVGVVLQQSFAKLTENAQTKADIEALKAQIQSLGEAGKLSGAELANALLAADVKMAEIAQATDPVAAAFRAMGVESRTATELQLRQAEAALRTIEQSGNATENALNQARNKVLELKNALDPTAQAFDRLGIKTKEALAQAATQQMSDFERVRQSGQATQADLQRAFQQTAQAALASGDVSAMAWVQSHAAAYQYKVVVDASGKANLQAAAETTAAATQQIAAHQQVAAAATQAAQAQSAAAAQTAADTDKVTQAASAGAKKLSELGQKVHYTLKQTGAYATFGTASWYDTIRSVQSMYINIHQTVTRLNDEMERGGNVAQWLAKAEALAIGNAQKLDKTTLSNLHAAIDKARAKMRQMADDAANTKKALEKQLLNAQGNTSAVAEMEQREALNNLQKQLQIAEKAGNQNAVADYQKSIELQKRIYQTELDRQRAEAEQAKREAAEAAEAEARAKQEAERAQREAQREQAQRESQRAAPTFTLPEIRLPEPQFDLSALDLSNVQIDTSAISDALAARDNANLAEIKKQLPQLINDLIPQIAQKLIEQMQKDWKRGM